MPIFYARDGGVIGYDHRNAGTNGQDARIVRVFDDVEPNDPLFGHSIAFCSDGCSNRKVPHSRNEIGAELSVQFLFSDVRSMIAMGIPLELIPRQLFMRYLGYLRTVYAATFLGPVKEMKHFIESHLMCTAFGVIMNQTKGMIVHIGDGFFVINDKVTSIDQNDHPHYVAHALLPPSESEYPIPTGFEVIPFNVADVGRVSISTDGIWQAMKKDGSILTRARNHAPGIKAGVQFFLNMNKGLFKDDATLIDIEIDHNAEVRHAT